MNASVELIVEALGWTLLHFVWQASLVAGVLFAALRLAPRTTTNSRYALGCAALGLMMGTAVATFAWQLNVASHDRAEIGMIADSQVGDFAHETVGGDASVVGAIGQAAPGANATAELSAWVPDLQPWLPTIVGLWAICVGLLCLRLCVDWNLIRRIRTRGREIEEPFLIERFADIHRELGVSYPVRLLSSTRATVPFVVGWLKPVILLPAGLLTGLSPVELQAILAHELAHVRRHDFLVNLVQIVIETLFFYHPAVWWVSAQVRQEREQCCDQIAASLAGGRLVYARALLALESRRRASVAFDLAANGGSLAHRIRRLVGESPAGGSRSPWPVAALCLVSGLLIALAAASGLGEKAVADAAAQAYGPTPTEDLWNDVSRIKRLLRSDDDKSVRRAVQLTRAIVNSPAPLYEKEPHLRTLRAIVKEHSETFKKHGLVESAALIQVKIVTLEAEIDRLTVGIPDDEHIRPDGSSVKVPDRIPDEAWGRAVTGLRLAAVPRFGSAGLGITIPFTLVVQNVSDGDIRFSASGVIQGARALVRRPGGEELKTTTSIIWGWRLLEHYWLKPGEQIALAEPSVMLVDRKVDDGPMFGVTRAIVSDGADAQQREFTVRYEIVLSLGSAWSRGADGVMRRVSPAKGEWSGLLASGNVAIRIKSPENKEGAKKPKEPALAFVLDALDVRSGRVVFKSRSDAVRDVVLRIERKGKPLEWRTFGRAGWFQVVVEASDKMTLEGGKTGHGIVFERKQSSEREFGRDFHGSTATSYIALDSSLGIAGKFSPRRRVDFVTTDGGVIFADITQPDGTRLPVSLRVEPRIE